MYCSHQQCLAADYSIVLGIGILVTNELDIGTYGMLNFISYGICYNDSYMIYIHVYIHSTY